MIEAVLYIVANVFMLGVGLVGLYVLWNVIKENK